MIHLITELSKYVMIILLAIYTWYSYVVLAVRNEERQKRMYKTQTTCMFLIHLDAFMVLFAVTKELKVLIFYGAQVLFVLFLFLIYRIVYKKAARLVINHMCMLMLMGFIILTRLNFDNAVRQFEIAVAAAVVSAFVPMLVRKLKFLRKFTWFYCAVGVAALGIVLVMGKMSGGAHLSFTVAGVTLQPSEFVKIIFVFFVACMLYEATDFRQVCITTIAAAVHVGFLTYVVMLYVATRKPSYFFGGLGVGCLAALVGSKLFSHVRVRIEAWKDPFASIHGGGWQVAQALFAIGTGGWFGLGLYQGMPDKIPLGASDFVFASISEEMGGAFAVCIVLVCFSCFLMFLNIAMQIKDQFYKLIALGFGCVYGVQVFLNVGGVIKFIPSTGLTLPLVSYGGSSILCTIVMFAIIQGLYIMRQDEEGELNEQKNRGRKQKKNDRTKKNSSRKPKNKSGQTGYRGHESGSERNGTSSQFNEEIEEIW